MSKFFKALEQAEQERALRGQLAPGPTSPPPGARRGQRDGQASVRTVGVEASPESVNEHLVSLLAPNSFEAEQYRALRHRVEYLRRTSDFSILAVSSAGGGDGKTTTAINLAGALAQAPDARVLLLDADLRHSLVMDYLGLENNGSHGLVDVILRPDACLDEAVRTCPTFNLSVLPAGRIPSAPYELLRSPHLEELLRQARTRYDYILLDTPALVPLPDCRLIAKWVDGFLVVVDAHRTPRKLLAEALDSIDPAKIIGLVFNSDDAAPGKYPQAGGTRGRVAQQRIHHTAEE